ncbi:ABC transporter ATP-binding protein [Candidatus Persebacteraceae bacterium Df01]|jgi:lipoprotein-releasing system ATP-binding protein|uniref:ABC transporter ATP-binding protein n=1 Tax=Candidatus Doriopsillibacter californiensis TaxID=2970740 RepID=A0ABT7QN18_9GAMM|nr:ABC transporter ATP-binding protein [Candidatus Persebacteraceae bacterium Df01]
MSNIVVCGTDLHKTFIAGGGTQQVLDGANLTVRAGETLAIAGTSGSGKTTLLHILGGLDMPDSGNVAVEEKEWRQLSPTAAARWRNAKLGFVFQFHLLLPEFTALENAAMPLIIRRLPREQAMERAHRCLEQLGMNAHSGKTPEKLSGGERQRVAVARALAGNPACILADEPTGNLDRRNADSVFNALLEVATAQHTAVIVVSHDERLAVLAQRRVRLIDGRLEELA